MTNHNYVYKITNKVNGKYYIGIHSTNDLDDGYFGSGKVLKNAVTKYGKHNFKKEIIEDFNTRKEAFQKERELVNVDKVEDRNCYNLKEGGLGNSSNDVTGCKNPMYGISRYGEENPFYGKTHTEDAKEKIRNSRVGVKRKRQSIDKQLESRKGYKHSQETKNKISKANKGKKIWANKKHPCLGKVCSEVTRQKISNSKKDKISKNSKLLIHLPTGTFYYSIKEASEIFDVRADTLGKNLKTGKEKSLKSI